MSANLFPPVKQQFFSNTGVPLVGGKVYTYDAGTLNPRVTYSDAAGTVPNANPIILDARGEATVFWSGAYKVVLKDALDNVLWSQDNVSDAGAVLASSIAASGGAALMGFIQAGAGTGLRTVQAKLRDTISILDFFANGVNGAMVDPTGALDSTAGIQAAVTAAAGKELLVPTGTYLMSAPVLMQSNTEVFFEPGSIVTTATPNISLFRAINKSKVHFFGFGKLQQTGVAGANAFCAGIEINGSSDCTVTGNLEFTGFQWAGVYIVNGNRNKVLGTYMHDWSGTVDNSAGVVVYQDSNDNVVEGNHFKATGWIGAYVQDPGGAGIYNPLRNKIRRNRIEGTTAYGAMLYIGRAGNSHNEIDENTISGVLGTANIGQYGMGIYCVGSALGSCKIIGNTVSTAARARRRRPTAQRASLSLVSTVVLASPSLSSTATPSTA
jgi:hypothetical protein